MDQSPDEDVAAAFSSGQPDTLALVYQRFGALVYSIALRSLHARSDAIVLADELAQLPESRRLVMVLAFYRPPASRLRSATSSAACTRAS